MIKALSFFAVTANAFASADYLPSPGIYDPKPYTTWVKSEGDSKLALIDVPFTSEEGSADNVHMYRMDMYGDAYARGFAHGSLLAHEIVYFTQGALNKYFMDMVLDLDVSQFPEPLQEILRIIQVKGALAAPAAFQKAMAWVYDAEIAYMPAELVTEMDAMAEGICSQLGGNCDVSEWQDKIHAFNMLPELIRMACTAFGAWGVGSASGDLLQVRALDFGGGPFANFTVLGVHHPSDDRAFATVGFPGFVGVITGVAQNGIGISEKVWMTYDTPELQPGSYDGEPDVFVLRDILQYSKNKKEAEDYMLAVRRTWAIFVGVGDFESQTMDIVGYKQDECVPYTDETMSAVTLQPYIDSVVYVDKHPQPTHSTDLAECLTDFHGNISMATGPIITRYHQTGDLHIAMYDFGINQMILSIGRINEDGDYGPVGGNLDSWKAYNRPFLQFDLDELWAGI